MKVLLDTSFIRHLSLVNQLELISIATNQLGWEFVIPKIVLDELSKKSIPRPFLALLKEEVIKTDCCTQQEILLLPSVILSLDDGELEAICIINKCEDRKFRNYIFLTDDGPAQKKAGELGMSSLDIVTFLSFLNHKQLFSKNMALQSLELLKNDGYYIEQEVRTDFIHRLV